MEIEQRYVIKYYFDRHRKGTQIIEKLKKHYKDNALTDPAIRYWIYQHKLGRTDLSDIPSSGRRPIEGLADQVQKEIEKDPHASARQIAAVLGVSPDTVRSRLINDLEMRCCHLRWVRHTLREEQKAKRVQMATSMLEALQMHEWTHFSDIYTVDESWMLNTYPYKTQWISKWE
jgi:hypothetical protein